MPPPALSLIVPTRGRADSLARFLASITSTATHLEHLEIILVVDDDAPPALTGNDPRSSLVVVSGPPNRTMGSLNADGYAASNGEFVMLLNDDVVVRTPGWDEKVLAAARHFSDGIVLVHVNDTLMRHHLCTFPLVSRRLCESMGGICPRDYQRFCIDDHIEDIFNILAFLGQRRTIYLPEVVFEHTNAVEMGGGVREYHADPRWLALDQPRFLVSFDTRKRLALDLLERIASTPPAPRASVLGGEGAGEKASSVARPASSSPEDREHRRERVATLATITDPLSLRTPGRQIVWSTTPPPSRLSLLAARIWRCWRERGVRGLVRAAKRRLLCQR